jgi:hypothetical protein
MAVIRTSSAPFAAPSRRIQSWTLWEAASAMARRRPASGRLCFVAAMGTECRSGGRIVPDHGSTETSNSGH